MYTRSNQVSSADGASASERTASVSATSTATSSGSGAEFNRSLGLRAQIKIVQLICSNKLMFKRMLRNLGGQDALILYRTVKDFFNALMDYNMGEGRKIVQALVQVFGEVFVLFTHRIVTVQDWAQWGHQIEEVMEQLCAFIESNHKVNDNDTKDLGIQLNNATPSQEADPADPSLLEFRFTYVKPPKTEAIDKLKPKLAETIQRAREVTLATIGTHLSDSSARKLQKVADKLCENGPLEEMCAFNSDSTDYAKMSFSVMDRMVEKEARRRELTGSLERIIRVPRI